MEHANKCRYDCCRYRETGTHLRPVELSAKILAQAEQYTPSSKEFLPSITTHCPSFLGKVVLLALVSTLSFAPGLPGRRTALGSTRRLPLLHWSDAAAAHSQSAGISLGEKRTPHTCSGEADPGVRIEQRLQESFK